MANTTDQVVDFLHAQRLLRCRKSQRYFTGAGWTDDPTQAENFPDDLHAARACVSHDLHDVELVLRTQSTGTELFCTAVR